MGETPRPPKQAGRYPLPLDLASALVGTDEAGKGDYFGPLVIAAVYVDDLVVVDFQEWGVRDSKKIADGRARSLARQIADAGVPTAVVAIGPERYNQLYAQMKNLNRILAWGHARAIENLLEKVPVKRVLADQFGDPRHIERALMSRGRAIALEQMHRGERDPAVAAASVIARAEFLRRLERLSQKAGVKLPKGAGAPVDEVAARLMARGGMELLATLAKCHFKNTQKAQRLRAAQSSSHTG